MINMKRGKRLQDYMLDNDTMLKLQVSIYMMSMVVAMMMVLVLYSGSC